MSDLEDLVQKPASPGQDDIEIGVEAADVLGSPPMGSNDENEEEESTSARRQTTLASSSTSISLSNSLTTTDAYGGECVALLNEPTIPSSPSTVYFLKLF